MSGCKAPAFQSFAKQRYEKIVPSASTTSEQMLMNLDREIAADPAMIKACGV